MKLTKAERLLIAQIVNIRLDNATLKDHIMLEGIYKATGAEKIRLPIPPDYVDNDEDKKLFQQYDGKQISEIEDQEHKEKLQNAIRQAREDEMKIWSNEGGDEEEVELTDEQIEVIKDFFDKDKRPFPREYHQVIIDLHDKLSGKSENKKSAKKK